MLRNRPIERKTRQVNQLFVYKSFQKHLPLSLPIERGTVHVSGVDYYNVIQLDLRMLEMNSL